MPYIKGGERRHQLRKNPFLALDQGELNFVITSELLDSSTDLDEKEKNIADYIDAYLTKNGRRYASYNEVIGVLTCAQYEYDRRKGNAELYFLLEDIRDHLYDNEIAPYEDKKIQENGDVY